MSTPLSRRSFLKSTAAVAAGASMMPAMAANDAAPAAEAAPKQQRPNILLITSDQHHWSLLGCKTPQLKTPALDRLAREGTLFNRAYCPNPTCTPTRASIITGQYPSQHGAWSLGTKLAESEQTVGALLGAAGYKTALVGKAHFQPLKGTPEYPSLEAYPVLQDLDYWRAFHGPFYGFDHVELARNHADEAHVGQHYALWMEEKGCANWRDYFRKPTGNAANQKHAWDLPEEYHYNTWIAERSNALLDAYAEQETPFFLWASFFDPHPPYLVPRPWDAMYAPEDMPVPGVVPGEHDRNPPHFQMTQERRPDFSDYQEPDGNGCHGFHSHLHDDRELARDMAVYYGMISCMDKYIGRILDQLDALGLTENTLVLFTTDHGHLYGQHGMIAKGPFHYEDLIRIPFIARQPGQIPAGRESNALVSLVDLAPTFLDQAGTDIPRTMAGKNLTPLLTGATDAVRDHVSVENHHQPTTLHARTYVEDRYKITWYFNHPYGELFDLTDDPGEVNNLWDAPEAQTLKAELMLRALHAEMAKETLWMPRIAGA